METQRKIERANEQLKRAEIRRQAMIKNYLKSSKAVPIARPQSSYLPPVAPIPYAIPPTSPPVYSPPVAAIPYATPQPQYKPPPTNYASIPIPQVPTYY